jgi:hypothetical protein
LVVETEQLPINVVGDLTELLPGDRLSGEIPSTVSEAELLSTAVATIIDLLERQSKDASG